MNKEIINMMVIKIKNLRIDVLLGVYEQERHKKQPIIINLEIDYNAGESDQTDDIKDTLDYHQITMDVTEAIENTDFELLESIVSVIEHRLKAFERIQRAVIEVDKPEAPIDNIDSVSVTKIFVRK
jgi:FolB domain-containing protein